jgi:2-octaprenyl-6-methoxyphenol hydroxylase
MVEVIISGGGLVGGVMGIALAQAGLGVMIVDREKMVVLTDPANDGRTTAVNYVSKLLMESLGVWQEIEPYAEPIWHIKAFEGKSPWSIQFDHDQVGDHPMGYIVENAYLRQAIIRRAHQEPGLKWCDQTHIIESNPSSTGVVVTLSSGIQLTASLLIVAEGRTSPTREAVGIRVKQLPYHQKGIVFSLEHEKPHRGVAWEVFYPEGPLAFLPAISPAGNRSGIVWTLPEEEADRWFAKDNQAIEAYLASQFAFYGTLKLIGKRWIFPLTAQIASRFVDQKMALVGDAAHVCHYVAGQGVNLGWRDVAVLRDLIVNNKRLGLDIGSQTMLQTYQRQRRLDSYAMVGSTDLTVRLFSNRSSLLYFLRNAGMGVANQLSPVKSILMRYAMGLLDAPPMLMRKGAL